MRRCAVQIRLTAGWPRRWRAGWCARHQRKPSARSGLQSTADLRRHCGKPLQRRQDSLGRASVSDAHRLASEASDVVVVVPSEALGHPERSEGSGPCAEMLINPKSKASRGSSRKDSDEKYTEDIRVSPSLFSAKIRGLLFCCCTTQ